MSVETFYDKESVSILVPIPDLPNSNIIFPHLSFRGFTKYLQKEARYHTIY